MVEEAKLDSKGRIVIPEGIRRKIGVRGGSELTVRAGRRSIVITKSREPKEFI